MIETFIAVTLGALRATGEKSEIFQAVAHLFVGGLFTAWWFSSRKLHLALAVGLSILELVCFFVYKNAN